MFRGLMIIFSIAVMLLLLLAGSASYIPPSKSLIIAFLGLSFPVLWLLNLIWLIFLVIFRSKALLLSMIVVLVITSVKMSHFYTLPLKPEKEAYPYSLFNFNAFGMRSPFDESHIYTNQNTIHRFINDQKFTVACFQEYPMKGAKHAKFYEKLQHDIALPHISMSEYEPDQKSTHFILVTASQFPVKEEKVLTYLSLPFAMYSDVAFPEGIVRIFNVHLQSVKFTGERKLLMFDHDRGLRVIYQHFTGAFKKLRLAFLHRETQALMLAESINASPYPVIVSGDFNDTPASYAYHLIAGKLRDASSFNVIGFKRTFKYSLIPLQIDYICTSPNIRSSVYRTITSPVSDHYAISTKLKIEALE